MSKRDDFEVALADYLKTMMAKLAKERGGINHVVNDLILAVDDVSFLGTESHIVYNKASIIGKALSIEQVKVFIQNLRLNEDLKPVWVYWVKFMYDNTSAWNIDDMHIMLNPDATFQVMRYSINDRNEKPYKPKVDDELWDTYARVLNGATMFSILKQ